MKNKHFSCKKAKRARFLKTYCSLCIAAILCLTTVASAQEKGNYLALASNATHIVRITKDTLVVVSGNTFSFTVDTPEDNGLVSTTPNASQLLAEVIAPTSSTLTVIGKDGNDKADGIISNGDHLVVSKDGKSNKKYFIQLQPFAVSGKLVLDKNEITAGTTKSLTLYFTAGQRTPDATVKIYFPSGINVTGDNTTVNVIGRGAVKLKDLSTQSMGRLGTNYPYKKVGDFAISKSADGGSILMFKGLDLRPANGADLAIVISGVHLAKSGKYDLRATYSTTKPEALTSAGTGTETAMLLVKNAISDFERVVDKDLQYKESPATYTKASFKWADLGKKTANVQFLQSQDNGKNWTILSKNVVLKSTTATVSDLQPNKLYSFRLLVKDGDHKGYSNIAQFYSGKLDLKSFNVAADGKQDNTDKINEAITFLHNIGGGTLLFSSGVYNVRTVHLQSNVYLFVDKGATIKALKGGDAPEVTWFSDRKYRSGLSPTDSGPYDEPENWLTKQDVGHQYFHNAMFFGERIDNVKIIGNGLISGNGNLVNGDGVMKNAADNRSDKMFVLKLCTNLEIGGIYRKEDLWYDSTKDEPYYIKNGGKDFNKDNMLQIDRTGHFALLATGTDGINVHDTYFGKNNTSNTRDIYDFMQCNNVRATNIFCTVTSDDIIKPGSDCSLGFTRPATHYMVRNIIGDTNCNLFQIGSETADDITDLHVDNIYVLGANKAGFSISTNDGAHIKDVHLNCGHTGSIHSRSKMFRTTAPFFISISNRGRILGASVAKYKFDENGVKHDELLVTNVNIGSVENIILNGVDVSEVYSGSSYSSKQRWKPFDGTQKRATSIVAGYALPDPSVVEGGLHFKLPNGQHTGYIKNIVFNDVHITDKGGNPLKDTAAAPPELGVGQYNVTNLKVQPSYGLWVRHAKDLVVKNSSFNFEKPDGRYAIFLDDVAGAKIDSIKAVKAKDNDKVIKLKNASNVTIDQVVYFNEKWGVSPTPIGGINTTRSVSTTLQ